MSAQRSLTRRESGLRIATWRGDATTAYLTPRGRPTAAAVARSLERLTEAGYQTALTAALGPADAAPFLDAGFAVHERLHLLVRPVGEARQPPGEGPLPRRGRRQDRAAVLEVDHAAFPPFWRLDAAALDDALAATPSSRLRVIDRANGGPSLAGYAVTGRAGSRGYLQRLAVDPSQQRQGLASRLVADALLWLRRWGAHEVLVNTQQDNGAALSLYESLGFRLQPHGLAVLRRAVDEPAR
ncbi:MAG: GNAT family N-acetyltransferase [Microthrixaceae bacterium]